MSFSWGVLTGRYGVLSQSWSPRSIPLLSSLSLRCGIDFSANFGFRTHSYYVLGF